MILSGTCLESNPGLFLQPSAIVGDVYEFAHFFQVSFLICPLGICWEIIFFKIKNFYFINKSIAPIGLLFTSLAIVTGSLWGQPTWGTWWAWDARLTSMLILMLFYVFYILSFKLINNEETTIKVSSIIAIVGSINIPIIKYSVDWWNTLHQPASIKISGSSSIHSAMLVPLLLMLLVFLLYAALIFLMKYKTEIIRIKKKNIKRI